MQDDDGVFTILAMAGRYDVIVVGVGSMGSSACYQLAKRGVKVLGLEQFSIPNTLGAAGGFSRMIRLSYFEHPDYVALLRRSYELWNQIEKDSGQKLLYVTGGAYVGLPGSELVSGSLQAAQQHGLEHDMLDRAQLADRFPQFNVPDDYEPTPSLRWLRVARGMSGRYGIWCSPWLE